jgi:iron-sulfur cluster repair protein YtfE (RIC family)
MCHYCGCRQIPLIRDYIAEHELVTDLGDTAVRALDHGDLAAAGEHVAAMSAELAAHWQGEEKGLFEVMSREQEYADYIAPLVDEHRELGELLAGIDLAEPSDQARFRAAVVELHEHISREEDGLFPASLIALGGQDWDAAIAAWHEAHPDRTLIAD